MDPGRWAARDRHSITRQADRPSPPHRDRTWRIDVPDVVDLGSLAALPLAVAGRVALRGRLVCDDDCHRCCKRSARQAAAPIMSVMSRCH